MPIAYIQATQPSSFQQRNSRGLNVSSLIDAHLAQPLEFARPRPGLGAVCTCSPVLSGEGAAGGAEKIVVNPHRAARMAASCRCNDYGQHLRTSGLGRRRTLHPHRGGRGGQHQCPYGTSPGECAAGETGSVQDVIEFEPSLFPAHLFIVSPLTLSESIRIEGPGLK